jgi:hypothetical protein
MVKQSIERFPQIQTKLGNLAQQGWGDSADYFRERHKMYGMFEFKLLPVIQYAMDDEVAAAAT